LDLDRNRRGTILCLAVKYRLRILHMGRYELIRDRDDRKYKILKLEQGRCGRIRQNVIGIHLAICCTKNKYVNIVIWNEDLEDKRNKESIGGGGKISISKEDVILKCLERKTERHEFLNSK